MNKSEKRKEKKERRKLRENSIDINQLDNHSLLIKTLKESRISKSEYANYYYKDLIDKYISNNLMFKKNDLFDSTYKLNGAGFVFGLMYYMYNGLYLGLFVTLLLSTVIGSIIMQYYPILLSVIPTMILPNLLTALLANFFMVRKIEKNAINAIKQKSDVNESMKFIEIKKSTEFRNLFPKFINFILAVPISMFYFYVMLIIISPEIQMKFFTDGFVQTMNYININIDGTLK